MLTHNPSPPRTSGRVELPPGGSKGHCWIDTGLLRFARDFLHVKTMLDIGCGTGGQVKEARRLGITAMGIDGDPSVHPDEFIDFTRQKFYSEKQFDLGWSVEFLEHVPMQFTDNYMAAFSACRFVFCTASQLASKHHHNLQHTGYWISLFERYNFIYSGCLYAEMLKHSTMRAYNKELTFFNVTGMAFIRNDVHDPFPPQTPSPWELM